MDNVLSQSEVNALLNAINQGSIGQQPEDDGVPADARSYDLTSNDRIIRGRMPTLDILNQRLARLLRVSFFNMFRKSVEVTHDTTQLLKYSEFIAMLNRASVELDRKVLADLAIHDPAGFARIIEQVKAA